ncbi:hypothetical protein [Saccharopolyspora pogona]|uniref:hypothetical protein n=1 Tax=Saccharopolyspora pogona TaxID=333966 RepID=UPI00168276B4|nr:hypothetical protein [Saccharopolyspora pogona]
MRIIAAAPRGRFMRRPEASPEELAEFETDVLAGFVLGRARGVDRGPRLDHR